MSNLTTQLAATITVQALDAHADLVADALTASLDGLAAEAYAKATTTALLRGTTQVNVADAAAGLHDAIAATLNGGESHVDVTALLANLNAEGDETFYIVTHSNLVMFAVTPQAATYILDLIADGKPSRVHTWTPDIPTRGRDGAGAWDDLCKRALTAIDSGEATLAYTDDFQPRAASTWKRSDTTKETFACAQAALPPLLHDTTAGTCGPITSDGVRAFAHAMMREALTEASSTRDGQCVTVRAALTHLHTILREALVLDRDIDPRTFAPAPREGDACFIVTQSVDGKAPVAWSKVVATESEARAMLTSGRVVLVAHGNVTADASSWDRAMARPTSDAPLYANMLTR